MPGTELKDLFSKGLEALTLGNTLSALAFFEKVIKIEGSPSALSYFAFCIAKERGQIGKAISLCKEALRIEPDNSAHYLNLGRIHLLAHKKIDAINVFREGLTHEANQQIIDELNRLVVRKPPVISFLNRNNPLNKFLGILLKRLGLR